MAYKGNHYKDQLIAGLIIAAIAAIIYAIIQLIKYFF
jgi:hypothetical protein